MGLMMEAMMNKPWIAIMSVDEAGVIGNGDKLPWKCPGDLKEFSLLTTHGALVMGRKTYSTVGDLKGRPIIVVSKSPAPTSRSKTTTRWVNSVDAIPDVVDGKQPWICGGRQIYDQCLPKCRALIVSRIEGKHEGDVLAPEFEHLFKYDATFKYGNGFTMERWVAK